jgi:hypothetical protein
MQSRRFLVTCVFLFLILGVSCKKNTETNPGVLHLGWAKVGSIVLSQQTANTNLPVDSAITISFNNKLDTGTARSAIVLKKSDQSAVGCRISFSNGSTLVRMKPDQPLGYVTGYTLQIGASIKGASGETFPGAEYVFTTVNGKLKVETITLNNVDLRNPAIPRNVDWKSLTIRVTFSDALDTAGYKTRFILSGGIPLSSAISEDHKTVMLQNTLQLADITKYSFAITTNLKAANGFTFDGFLNSFYTAVDTVPKFPVISDDELLTLIQQKVFSYFYDFAHPACGMARERNTSGNLVTTGGSGFGVMALVVGMNRNFISRNDGLVRLDKILTFLETCDRYHGAWPHWLNGSTGKAIPFSPHDDGGDLVETSYMVQGLLTMRQYLDSGVPAEKELADRITVLTAGVEYDWFTRGQDALYWHWSPNYGWENSFRITGYNETLITYVVASTSATHPISAAVYHKGYALSGGIKNGNSYYGYVLPLGPPYGGPLFFTHYSYLGLNPKTLQDAYANYWQQNVNQSLINWSYCVHNPMNWVGYGTACWGLTASDNPWGYDAQSPTNDLGVITPTAAVSALPYTPEQSMKAIRNFYYVLGNRLWGEYGFYDAFDMTEGWWSNSTLAIDQGPQICMIENYRTGLLWNLFMSCPEVNSGLTKLGFTW